MIKILLPVFLLVFVMNVHSQDFKKTLLDMHEAIEQSGQMRIVMDIAVYENAKQNNLLYHDKAEIAKSGKNYLYHYSNNDFLMGPTYIIMVDKNEREITCSRRDTASEAYFTKSINFNIDSIFAVYKNPQYIATEKGTDHFRVQQEKSEIFQIDLFVNAETNLMQKMRYVYRNGQIVSIDFDVFDLHPAFDMHQFDEENYVVARKGRLYTAIKFKNFKIMSADWQE